MTAQTCTRPAARSSVTMHASTLMVLVYMGLAGCATPQLDRRLQELRKQVAAEAAVVGPLADPYRAPTGKDVMAETAATPLLQVSDAFNEQSLDERTLALRSYDYSGYIARNYVTCPWPLDHEKVGYKVIPAFKETFAAAVYVDKIESSWNEKDGLAFRLKRSVAAAGMFISGRLEFCGAPSVDIPVGLAVVVGGANSAAGTTRLSPIPNEGIEYRIVLDQPIFLIANVVTPVFSAGVPLWLKFDLSKGKIPNIMGRKGEIRLTKIGEVRRYILDIKLDAAQFLPAGLMVSGPVDLTWE